MIEAWVGCSVKWVKDCDGYRQESIESVWRKMWFPALPMVGDIVELPHPNDWPGGMRLTVESRVFRGAFVVLVLQQQSVHSEKDIAKLFSIGYSEFPREMIDAIDRQRVDPKILDSSEA